MLHVKRREGEKGVGHFLQLLEKPELHFAATVDAGMHASYQNEGYSPWDMEQGCLLFQIYWAYMFVALRPCAGEQWALEYAVCNKLCHFFKEDGKDHQFISFKST